MDYDESYKNYQLNRSWLRRFVRKIFLKNQASLVKEKAIDFGCGIGELLDYLPSGSMGLEVNQSAVNFCQSINRDVMYYDLADNYCFSSIPKDTYSTFIISHVLEHLDHPEVVFRDIVKHLPDKGIERVIVIVPGQKGFNYDSTHKTFIDGSFFEEHDLVDLPNYKLISQRWFPLNVEWLGNYFTHHEQIMIFDKK